MENKYSDILRGKYKNDGLSDNQIIEDLLRKHDQLMGIMKLIMETNIGVSLGLVEKPDQWDEFLNKINLVVK